MNKSNPLIRTIIIDDEKPSRDTLVIYLKEYCQSLEIIAECKSIKEAYKAINEYKPQLVFLDIEMPRGNGFDLLRRFANIEFSIIFVTAFSEYATMAFRFAAVDYLLKPVKVTELIEAVKRVREKLESRSYENLKALLENLENQSENYKKLVIPNQKGFDAVNIPDIIMCEADGYCTIFYITGGRRITSAYNLKYYTEMLPPEIFFRVHNSCTINLNHVNGYSHQGIIMLNENLRAPLSKTNRISFLSLYNNGGVLRNPKTR
ncbi:MAG TPA: LytTR family DNA-binding domain-containing protein [Bacteroidales bacterium]|nr:LytTR family DNA-binding domain-containing protein [Bacteroidales bacterium]